MSRFLGVRQWGMLRVQDVSEESCCVEKMPRMATSPMAARTFRCANTQHAPVRSVVQDCWSRPIVPGAAGIAARTLKPVRPATAGSKREWANTVDSMAARTTRSAATRKRYETSVQDKGCRQSGAWLRGAFTLALTAPEVR